MWSIPKWMIDPMGPLSIRPAYIPHLMPWLLSYLGHSHKKNVAHIAKALHAINCRVSEDYDPMLAKIGYADKVRDKGCIRVYDNYESFKLSAQERAIRKQYGQHELLGEEDLCAMESSIGKAKTFGVFQPQWRILVSSLREWLVSQGVAILAANVDTLITQDKYVVGIKTLSGDYLADVTVVAAGAWSKQLSKQMGETCLLESERGYNTTLPYPNIQLNHELLFAEQMFAVSPLSMGVRVGGSSEFAGLSTVPNYKCSGNLLALAKRFLPELDTQNG